MRRCLYSAAIFSVILHSMLRNSTPPWPPPQVIWLFFCIYGFFSCWLHLKTLFLSFFFLGDSKESFYFGSLEGALAQRYPNQWPPEGKYIYFLLPVSLFSFKRFLSYPSRVMCLCVKDLLPSWRQAMECYYKNVL